MSPVEAEITAYKTLKFNFCNNTTIIGNSDLTSKIPYTLITMAVVDKMTNKFRSA